MLTRRTVIAAKAEGTPGTAETLDATHAVFFAYVGPDSYVENTPTIPRPNMSGGQNAATHGARMATLTFDVDFAGKGASGNPYWSVLFTGCGGTVSTQTWSFGLTAAPLTIAIYIDGTIRKLVGAMGTFTINLTSGAAGRVQFTFTGKVADDADATLLAPTYESVVPPRFAAGTASLASYALKASALSIVHGGSIKLREDPADATGYHSAVITNLEPSATVDPEQEALSTKNWQSIKQAGTTGALSVVVGSAANNTQTIAGTAQVLEDPSGDRDGLLVRRLGLGFVWTGQSGTSPFTVIFS